MYLGVKPLGNNYISITNFDLQRIEFIFAATYKDVVLVQCTLLSCWINVPSP